MALNTKGTTAPETCHDEILDSINEGVFTVDLNWRIKSINRAAEQILGIRREDAIGQQCREVFRASICENACALKKTMVTGKPCVDTTVYIVDKKGKRIPIKISSAALRDEKDRVIGGVETFQDLRQIEELKRKLLKHHTYADIIGQGPAMTQLFDILPQIADSESNVLIEGDSGTGKELFARAIHDLSPRRGRKFVAVNCGALPDTLLESELFGYKAGAFTDARRDKPGRFSLAHGGSLFLDEVGNISQAMQVRLLRVLQERTFEPLGSVTSVRTNARVIAATNRNLSEMVKEGSFREDFFYRLHVVHIEIPRLNDRREDIHLLAEHFIDEFNRLQGKSVTGFSHNVLGVLMEHDYAGNVRELKNIIEHAFVLCQGDAIQLEHLPGYVYDKHRRRLFDRDGRMSLKAMEEMLITESLRRHRGNRRRVAEELGIHTSTLFRKIRALKIDVPEMDGRSRLQ